MMWMAKSFAFFVTCGVLIACSDAWKSEDKVLLRDVSVLTLYEGKMTNGRRSAAVPQLTCVGGTAKGKFHPKVVQCYNRGFDGSDVQWECKTDMDNEYRFGNIQVSCEGYDHPNDPYILKGSCGLEYELDYSKSGWDKKNSGGNNYGYGADSTGTYTKSKGGFGLADVIFFAILALFIYVIYKMCVDPGDPYGSGTHGGPPGGGNDRGSGGYPPGGGGGPPPPGFRPDYGDDSCSGARHRGANSAPPPRAAGNADGGPGFWTGALGGGLLGYLFGGNRGYGGYGGGYGGYGGGGYGGYGQRNRGWFGGGGGGYGGHQDGYYDNDDYGGYGNSGWGGGGGWGSGGGGGGGGSSSSGTRSASGFGGTTRR